MLDRFVKDFGTMLGYFLKLFRHKKDVFRNKTGTKQETKWKRNGNETEQEASKKKSALPVPYQVRFMKMFVFPKEFQGFLVSEALQVGSMLDLVL